MKKTAELEKEIDNVQTQIDGFTDSIKSMTMDEMNKAPKVETEPQAKISQNELDKSKDHYLKPARVINSQQKFNERFRKDYEFDKEYVQFIAENNESHDRVDIWTRPYPGTPAEFWEVPVGKPVWGPRYLAEQIKAASYHRLTMENKVVSADGQGQYYGALVVDKTIQRLDAKPVGSKKSFFMGALSR